MFFSIDPLSNSVSTISRCHRPAHYGRQWARDLPSTGPHSAARHTHSRSAQRSRPAARRLASEPTAVPRFYFKFSIRAFSVYPNFPNLDFPPSFVHECVSICICLFSIRLFCSHIQFVCLFVCLSNWLILGAKPRKSNDNYMTCSCLIITTILI